MISVRPKPGVSVGTRKAETPLGPASPVRANTRQTSAQVPLVMKILVPSMTQSDPSLVARVIRFAASDPVPGSVSAKHPSCSPAHSGGRKRRFCSSVP